MSEWPQIRAELNGRSYKPAGYFYAVDGTSYAGAPAPPHPITDNGVGYWSGFSSGMVGGLTNVCDGLWVGRCIGYPAVTVPMWPSVQTGRQNLVSQIRADVAAYTARYGSLDGFAMCMAGYSQGSMVTDQVWVLDILPEDGVLHDVLPHVYRSYQFGHIFRTPGIAHGNALIGLPESIMQDGVQTGGIGTGQDLTAAQTNHVAPDGKPVVYSCANPGDLYTCCPTGTNPWTDPAPEAKVGDLFWQVVKQPTLEDILSTLSVVMELEPAVIELWNTLDFFAQGTNAPHYHYYPQMDACITDAYQLGMALPHELGS